MQEIQRKIPEEVVELIQKLQYETDGLKVLHTHALQAGTDRAQLKEIRREYLERYAEYEIAKKEMWAPLEKDYPGAVWHLDFHTGIITIKRDGQNEKQTCGAAQFS